MADVALAFSRLFTKTPARACPGRDPGMLALQEATCLI